MQHRAARELHDDLGATEAGRRGRWREPLGRDHQPMQAGALHVEAEPAVGARARAAQLFDPRAVGRVEAAELVPVAELERHDRTRDRLAATGGHDLTPQRASIDASAFGRRRHGDPLRRASDRWRVLVRHRRRGHRRGRSRACRRRQHRLAQHEEAGGEREHGRDGDSEGLQAHGSTGSEHGGGGAEAAGERGPGTVSVAAVEARAQHREPTLDARARRLDRHADPGCDLGRGQVVQEAQHDRGPVGLVQPRHLRTETSVQLRRRGDRVAAGDALRLRTRVLHFVAPRLAPHQPAHAMPQHRVEPGARPHEGRRLMHERREHGVLHDVVGEGVIAGEAQREAPEAPQLAPELLFVQWGGQGRTGTARSGVARPVRWSNILRRAPPPTGSGPVEGDRAAGRPAPALARVPSRVAWRPPRAGRQAPGGPAARVTAASSGSARSHPARRRARGCGRCSAP